MRWLGDGGWHFSFILSHFYFMNELLQTRNGMLHVVARMDGNFAVETSIFYSPTKLKLL